MQYSWNLDSRRQKQERQKSIPRKKCERTEFSLNFWTHEQKKKSSIWKIFESPPHHFEEFWNYLDAWAKKNSSLKLLQLLRLNIVGVPLFSPSLNSALWPLLINRHVFQLVLVLLHQPFVSFVIATECDFSIKPEFVSSICILILPLKLNNMNSFENLNSNGFRLPSEVGHKFIYLEKTFPLLILCLDRGIQWILNFYWNFCFRFGAIFSHFWKWKTGKTFASLALNGITPVMRYH